MKISKTTSYEITFSIVEYLETEGGMIRTVFKSDLSSIELAIHNLELACATNGNADWVIVMDVKTIINSK